MGTLFCGDSPVRENQILGLRSDPWFANLTLAGRCGANRPSLKVDPEAEYEVVIVWRADADKG